MAIKKFQTLEEYNHMGRSDKESTVSLISEGNQVKYDGVNVNVSIPKPGDYIYRDSTGELHYIAAKGIKRSLLPASWTFVELYYYGWTDDVLVDMGLPSGVKWAKVDIDLTKPSKLGDTPFIYEKSFFSWGNIDGHNPSSASAFAYNWGDVNETEPYYEGQVYGSTPGGALTASFAADSGYDAARENLSGDWRMPSNANFTELFNNIRYIDAAGNPVASSKTDKRVVISGIRGLYLESKVNGNRLFFSASGRGSGRSWYYRDSRGLYWSSTFSSARDARYLSFNSGGVSPSSSGNRYSGFAVRPVQ